MANDEKGAKEKSGDDENFDFDEIDKEAGPGDILKDRDHKHMKDLKNVFFVLLLAVIGLAVLGVSFKLGEKIFLANKTMFKGVLQENVTPNSKEMPVAAIVPKADESVAGEVKKSGVNGSAPVKKIESASDRIEKVNNPVTVEKNLIQPGQKVVASVAEVEKPAATAKPETTAPAVMPAAIPSTVKPAVEAPKPAAKQKTAAAKASKTLKKYKVIAASFSIRANADSLMSQLKAKNYKPIIVQAETPKGQFYRVIVGSYRSLSKTKTTIGELKKLGFQPFYIVE